MLMMKLQYRYYHSNMTFHFTVYHTTQKQANNYMCVQTWKIYVYICCFSISQLSDEHRSKALCLLLHTADISHPGKPWETHLHWTTRITDEFFRQGDWEKELSLPPSPLCDRSTTLLTESQIGEY